MKKRGRPTKCNEATQQKAYDYANGAWRGLGRMVPSTKDLCRYINVPRSTIYDWAKRDDNNFSDILELVKITQEVELIDKGLTGEFNSNIVKLMLGKHGYKSGVSVF